MLIPSHEMKSSSARTSLSRRVNANSQRNGELVDVLPKLIKKGEC